MNTTPVPPIALAHQIGHAWGDQALFECLDVSFFAGVTLLGGEEQSGKTTLLRILAGELTPNRGWVQTMGLRADQRPEAYAQKVFRTDPLNAALDQTSPVQWWATLAQRYPGFSASMLADLAKGLGLTPHMEKPMYMLSAGSRRKVGLSAAFASSAPLTLIDQPFAALDLPSIRLLLEVLQDLADQTTRACVVADYQAPNGVPLAGTVVLL
jgi:ABC-type multidrug transport system ATPase subunit